MEIETTNKVVEKKLFAIYCMPCRKRYEIGSPYWTIRFTSWKCPSCGETELAKYAKIKEVKGCECTLTGGRTPIHYCSKNFGMEVVETPESILSGLTIYDNVHQKLIFGE